MPVSIGTTENTFANPIGLLSDCHRRIERFLQALLKVTTDVQGGALDTAHRDALEAALQYFRLAAPKHTSDEEEDLFPALRELEQPCVRSMLARLDHLEAEHKNAAAWHAEVEEIGERWLRQDGLSGPEAVRLKILLTELSDLYRAHIAFEDQEVFPLAQEVLSDSAKNTIGRRMALRRGVPFIANAGPNAQRTNIG
jgi:hemerythrin-like domain-containing protein